MDALPLRLVSGRLSFRHVAVEDFVLLATGGRLFVESGNALREIPLEKPDQT